MVRRPVKRSSPSDDEDGNVIDMAGANWRFKWLERDMKALNERTDHVIDRLDKIDKRILIMGSVIIGVVIGGKLLSDPMLELLKKLVGL